MITLIVCSINDPAGTNIRERLLENFPFEETRQVFERNPVYAMKEELFLVSTRQHIVFVDNLDGAFNAESVVFISKHYAESGIPSLTAHFTGNFGKAADFGGNPGELASFFPSLLKSYMLNLKSVIKETGSPSYELTLEATHHGPTALRPPVLFVELGSADAQWRDVQGARQVATALMKTLLEPKKFPKCALCIGGTHYSEKFNRFLLESEYAIGPIIPKYGLEFFSRDLLKQVHEKSAEPLQAAAIDKKGLGKSKERVLEILNASGLEKIFL
jgi:D-aminoacyl-tRNA deacylase